MVWKPGNFIPINLKPAPRRICAERRSAMDLSTGKTVAPRLSAGSQTVGLAADPPLTVKITDMLDEVQKRLHSAASELNGLSGRLFGDETGYGSDSPSEPPSDFAGLVAERMHYLIGLAGEVNGAATRINNRI